MDFEMTETPGAEWDEFVSRYTGIIFYSSIWGEVLKDGLGARLLYSYIRDKGEIVGGMPGILLKHAGVRLFYCSLPYGGYIGEKSFFPLFSKKFMQHTSSFDIIHILPYSADPEIGYSDCLKLKETAISRMDISGKSMEEIKQKYPSSLKRCLNQAYRLRLRIKKYHDYETIDNAYKLYLQTMIRNKAIARYPLKWFNTIFKVLNGKELASLYMVDYNGLPIAAATVIHSKKGAHLLHVMSDTAHLSLRPNDFMIHEIIRQEVEKGKHFIDYLHSDPVDKKLIRWKEKFGFHTQITNNYIHVNSLCKYALWNGLKKIYPLISSFVEPRTVLSFLNNKTRQR